jgi:LysM repeat protein
LPTYTPYPTFTPPPTEPFTQPTTQIQVLPPTSTEFGVVPASPTIPSAQGEFASPTIDPNMDPRFLTATAIVQGATQAAVEATQTAIGPVVELPTFTPTFDPFQPTPTQGFVVPTVPGSDCVHEVVAGETMYGLSARYGVPILDIARVSNVLDVERLSIGQRLTIPGCGTTGAVPPPTSTPLPPPGTATPLAVGTPGPATPVPSAGGIVHRVQQGETLFIISQRYGVPMDAIAAANNLTDYDRINFNQELIIP